MPAVADVATVESAPAVVPMVQLLGGLGLGLIFLASLAVIRSIGRAVRPRAQAKPTDCTDLWTRHRVPFHLMPDR